MIQGSKMRQRYFLNLSRLHLEHLISGTLKQGQHLRGVNLSFNHLTLLPEIDVRSLTNLCFLDLSCNQLIQVPSALSSLSCLVDLKLSRNRLTSLPDTLFSSLARLEALDLALNRISALPQSVSCLTSLITLRVDGNPLTTLPFGLSKLKFLRHFSFDGCPLLQPQQQQQQQQPQDHNDTPDTPDTPPQTVPVDVVATEGEPSAPKVPTLKELAARVLVRCSIPVTEECAPKELVSYLASSSTCSFCSGPYFDHHVKGIRFLVRSGTTIPMEYRLCCSHWKDENDRILALFRPAPPTSPITLPKEQMAAIVARNYSRAATAADPPVTADISARKTPASQSNNISRKKVSRRLSTASHQGTAAAATGHSLAPSKSRKPFPTSMEIVDEHRTGLWRLPFSH